MGRLDASRFLTMGTARALLTERFEHSPKRMHRPLGERRWLVSDQFSCSLLSAGARVCAYDFGLVFGHFLALLAFTPKIGNDRRRADERAPGANGWTHSRGATLDWTCPGFVER